MGHNYRLRLLFRNVNPHRNFGDYMTNLFLKTTLVLASIGLGVSTSFCASADPAQGMLGASAQSYNADAMTWSTATAQEFEKLSGDVFSVLTTDNRSIPLTMTEVVTMALDENRPAFLGRKQGFIAVFSGSDEDARWLLNNRSHSMKVWHKDLGNGQALVSAMPKEAGGYEFEIVFN